MKPRSIKSLTVALAMTLIAPLAIFTASAAQADETPLIAPAPESSAASEQYVYWSFFTAESGGEWTYSQVGPAATKAAENTLIGYRWGVGEGEPPRTTTDFDRVCADTVAAEGQHLVALAIDPGTPGSGTPNDVTEQCISVAADTNALQALQGAAQVRLGPDNAMVCGINGFPATECSYKASENPADGSNPNAGSPAATVNEPGSASGSIVPILIGAGIILALLAFGATLLKQRKNSPGDKDLTS